MTSDAASKTHFVLIDAVGVYDRLKTDEPALERKRSLPLKAVLHDVALGKWKRDEDLLYTLAGRLGRLARRVTPSEEEQVQASSGGATVHELAARLVEALDLDVQLAAAREATGNVYLDDPEDQAVKAVAKAHHGCRRAL